MISLGPNEVNRIDCRDMKPEDRANVILDWNRIPFEFELDFDLLKDLYMKRIHDRWDLPCLKVGREYNGIILTKSSGSWDVLIPNKYQSDRTITTAAGSSGVIIPDSNIDFQSESSSWHLTSLFEVVELKGL